MRGFFAIRGLIRLLVFFGQSLYRGEAWAFYTLLGAIALAVAAWLVAFARKPLGGDPEEGTIDERQFGDEKNPYRDLT